MSRTAFTAGWTAYYKGQPAPDDREGRRGYERAQVRDQWGPEGWFNVYVMIAPPGRAFEPWPLCCVRATRVKEACYVARFLTGHRRAFDAYRVGHDPFILTKRSFCD